MSVSNLVPSNFMDDALTVLRGATQELNQLTDRGNELVRAVETELERQSIGISTQILIEEDEESEYFFLIGYVYVDGKLRLSLIWGSRNEEDSLARPWVECNRDDKLRSLEFLPALLVKLADEVQRRVVTAKSAIESVESAMLPTKSATLSIKGRK
jgi:hypothetical protein